MKVKRYCPHCGAEVKFDGQEYCWECGKALDAQPTETLKPVESPQPVETPKAESVTNSPAKKGLDKHIIIGVLAAVVVIVGLVFALGSKDNSSTTKLTPDLAMFDLQGPVESFRDKDYYCINCRYDLDGRLTHIESDNLEFGIMYGEESCGRVYGGPRVKRDEKGRILWIGIEDGCSGEQGFHFTYDSEGRLESWYEDVGECYGMGAETVTKRNGRGLIEESEYINGDEEGEMKVESTYTYTSFDSHNNWTEVTVYYINTYTTYNDLENDMDDDMTCNSSEKTAKRIITYYEY